jgi:hypothetical protein
VATEEQSDALFLAFQETDEMEDWDEFVLQSKKLLEADPEAKTISVPAAFLRRVILDIGATPLMFTAYRDRFNQLCEELGIPEEKRKG